MVPHPNHAQNTSNIKELWESYPEFKEATLQERRFSHQQVLNLLGTWEKKGLKLTTLGASYEGREIKVITWGEGSVDVLMWTQMHGDEATATRAVFDLLNYLDQDLPEIQSLAASIKIHIIPMLNPDGAHRFQRRTAQGIDMNRDALALQCPESRLLKSYRDAVNPQFGFNLHDQNIYYNVAGTSKPATISFLAPAYDSLQGVNPVRLAAMQVIAVINDAIQEVKPGQVGKYDDTFEPRAFGDNMQKWGSSTILIESGGDLNDPEKQQARALNFISLVVGLKSIAEGNYKDIAEEDYWQIPDNHRNLHDLLIRNLTVESSNEPYQMDLAIRRAEYDHEGAAPIYYQGSFEDTGDLSTHWGYEEFDAQGYSYVSPKVYPQTMEDLAAARQLDLFKLLREGFTAVRLRQLPTTKDTFPLDMLGPDANPNWKLTPDHPASLILQKEGVPHYAIINGFLQEINSEAVLESQGRIHR